MNRGGAVRDAVVRGLAARFRGFDLAGAATTRIAVELASRHDGVVPVDEIEKQTERFGAKLKAACGAMRPTPE